MKQFTFMFLAALILQTSSILSPASAEELVESIQKACAFSESFNGVVIYVETQKRTDRSAEYYENLEKNLQSWFTRNSPDYSLRLFYKLIKENKPTISPCIMGEIIGTTVAGEDAHVISAMELSKKYLSIFEEEGLAEAQFQLGVFYTLGLLGLEQDYALSTIWLNKAIGLGHKNAPYFLGILYLSGEGVIKDSGKGIELIQTAAQNGYALAQFRLGVQLYNGDGLERDLEKAFYWLELAANSGHPESQRIVGLAYYEGDFLSTNKVKGEELLRQASINGDDEAIKLVSEIDENRERVRDLEARLATLDRELLEDSVSLIKLSAALGSLHPANRVLENGQMADPALEYAISTYEESTGTEFDRINLVLFVRTGGLD